MALIHSLEKSGNFLFKYRGQIPVIIFLIGMPMIYFGHYDFLTHLSVQNREVFRVIILILSIAVSLAGFLVRAYTIGTTPRGTSGRNTDKQVAEQLNTKGIYSVVRHPLYLGNYLMWAGLLIFSMNFYLFVIISLCYWLYYERIIFTEERYLEKCFGEDFIRWSKEVPAFVPSFKNYRAGNIPFSFKAVLRREYAGFFAMVFSFTVVDYWLQFTFYRHYPEIVSVFQWFRPSLIVLLVALVCMLVLRTLKHHTNLLNAESNRD